MIYIDLRMCSIISEQKVLVYLLVLFIHYENFWCGPACSWMVDFFLFYLFFINCCFDELNLRYLLLIVLAEIVLCSLIDGHTFTVLQCLILSDEQM